MVISFLVLRVSGRQSAECRQVFEVIARIAQLTPSPIMVPLLMIFIMLSLSGRLVGALDVE